MCLRYLVRHIKWKHRLRLLESGVLRRLFGNKREEVTGELIKLLIE